MRIAIYAAIVTLVNTTIGLADACKDGKCQVKPPLVAVKVGPVKVEVGGGKVKHKRAKCKCKGCRCKATK